MTSLNAAESANDTGIPADMVVDGEEKVAADAAETGKSAAKDDAAAAALRDLIAKHDKQMGEYKARFDEQGNMIRELLESNKAAETRGYSRAKEEIDAKRREAVANADVAAFQAAEEELANLEKTRTPKKADPANDEPSIRTNGTQQPAQVSPAVSAWVKDNAWFESDFELNGVAIGLNAKLIKEKPGLSEKERLDEVTRRVKERYPEMFENKARSAPAAVAASTTPPTNQRNKKAKTVADLDEHGKAALAKLQRIIPGYTAEEYLKTYKWE